MRPPVLSQAEKEELVQPVPAEYDLFEATFGASLSTCRDKLMSARGLWALDTMQLRLMLMDRHNYDPRLDGSMEAFVASTFGPGAAELLERLLGIKPALKEPT